MYAGWWDKKHQKALEVFSKCGVDTTMIGTDEDYVKPLIKLFKLR